MPRVQVDAALVRERLFPGATVRIEGVTWDAEHRVIIFDVQGPDAPDSAYATCHVTQERARFEPI